MPMRRAGRRGDEDRDSHHSDAVQLLRRLAADGALRQENGRYVLASAGQPSEQGQAVACALVRRCIASDWLRKEGEDLKPSDAGVAYLRRAAAQSDPFRQQHQLPVTAERKIGGVCKAVESNTRRVRGCAQTMTSCILRRELHRIGQGLRPLRGRDAAPPPPISGTRSSPPRRES